MPIIENLMEQICELCHYPYVVSDQDAMDEICETCSIEDKIRELMSGSAERR